MLASPKWENFRRLASTVREDEKAVAANPETGEITPASLNAASNSTTGRNLAWSSTGPLADFCCGVDNGIATGNLSTVHRQRQAKRVAGKRG